MEELYDLVEHVIDKAFMQGEMKFNLYEYLKGVQAKKYEVDILEHEHEDQLEKDHGPVFFLKNGLE